MFSLLRDRLCAVKDNYTGDVKNSRKQPPGAIFQNRCSATAVKNFVEYLWRSSFFNIIAGFRPVTLLKINLSDILKDVIYKLK